jgi:hypothetical protein
MRAFSALAEITAALALVAGGSLLIAFSTLI